MRSLGESLDSPMIHANIPSHSIRLETRVLCKEPLHNLPPLGLKVEMHR